jgi:hypothetical protein
MMKAVAACLAAALMCSGCIFDDEWYDDCIDDECDSYFDVSTPPPSPEPLAARPR